MSGTGLGDKLTPLDCSSRDLGLALRCAAIPCVSELWHEEEVGSTHFLLSLPLGPHPASPHAVEGPGLEPFTDNCKQNGKASPASAGSLSPDFSC